MARVSSYDETVNENIIEYFPSDFDYSPVVGDWVGVNALGKIVKKNSTFTSDDPDVTGVVMSVRRKVRVLNSGYWKTNLYDSLTNGDTLFLGSVPGEYLTSIENTTNFVKKCATKVPKGIIVDIEPADKYQHIIID